MNPLLLVIVDLFFSACFALLVLYVAWRWIQPHMPSVTHTVKKDASEDVILKAKGRQDVETDEPNDEVDDGDITQRAERLKEKGLSVEKIAGQLKVPTGEIEMVLALSEMKKIGQGPGRRKSVRNPKMPQRAVQRKERQGFPVTPGRGQQKVWLDKQPL